MRQPENTEGMAFFDVESIQVAEWGPLPDGKGPPEQVHLLLAVPAMKLPLVVRFKSPASLDALITDLIMHRRNVWGGPPQIDEGGRK